MNKIKSLLTIVIVLLLTSCDNKTIDKKIDNQLNQLLEKKEYFKLNEVLEKNEDKLAEDRLFYYKAFVSKAFGQKGQSNNFVSILLEKYKNTLNDTLLVKLLNLKATNFINNYQYKQASETYNTILVKYPKVLDSADVANYKNLKSIFGTFANVPPQTMQPHKTTKIPSYRNKFNHLMATVKSNAVEEDFIFDTGANFSTISESQAKKMNFTIFEENVEIGSSTNIVVQSKLAVADNLYVGDILFKNVVFIVMPDSQLTFPEMNYKIHGIIGFPIIHQLEEVHLNKDGSITIPDEPKDEKLSNMVLDGLNPVVKITSGSDTLLFTLDTGAKNSELSFKYFNEHKSYIQKNGKYQTNIRGGAGGQTEVKEYAMSNFPIKIGKKSTVLPRIPVTLEEYGFNKYFDGNLGQDVFTQFNTLIINFKYMFVDFE